MIELISSKRLTKQLEYFRQFLISSWPYLDILMENHDWDNDMDFIDDWLQTNWEFLIERELLGQGIYLSPLAIYLSTRTITKNASPNYSVITLVSKNVLDFKTGKYLPKNCALRLLGFCSELAEGGTGLYPPFDLVDLVSDSTREHFIASFSELEFQLMKLD